MAVNGLGNKEMVCYSEAMIISLASILLAFYWLMLETDWLRIRLLADESYQEYDARILKQIDNEWEASGRADDERAYEAWLRKRYEPKLVYGFIDRQQDNPQDQWLAKEENLAKRRAGEMIYQRGSKVNAW